MSVLFTLALISFLPFPTLLLLFMVPQKVKGGAVDAPSSSHGDSPPQSGIL